jgi:hypothetical protein
MMQSENRWEFYQDKMKMWQWRNLQENRVVAVSASGFSVFKECVDNATSRGYVAPMRNVNRSKGS